MGLNYKFEKLHRSFENEIARYFSNFGNKRQKMIEISNEYGFMSNSDMPRPFTPRKMANSQSDSRTASSILE